MTTSRTYKQFLMPTRYDLAVQGMGSYGDYVTELAQLGPALYRAHAAGRAACVNVLIDGQAAPVYQ